jgi:hypothetical protein
VADRDREEVGLQQQQRYRLEVLQEEWQPVVADRDREDVGLQQQQRLLFFLFLDITCRLLN